MEITISMNSWGGHCRIEAPAMLEEPVEVDNLFEGIPFVLGMALQCKRNTGAYVAIVFNSSSMNIPEEWERAFEAGRDKIERNDAYLKTCQEKLAFLEEEIERLS